MSINANTFSDYIVIPLSDVKSYTKFIEHAENESEETKQAVKDFVAQQILELVQDEYSIRTLSDDDLSKISNLPCELRKCADTIIAAEVHRYLIEAKAISSQRALLLGESYIARIANFTIGKMYWSMSGFGEGYKISSLKDAERSIKGYVRDKFLESAADAEGKINADDYDSIGPGIDLYEGLKPARKTRRKRRPVRP